MLRCLEIAIIGAAVVCVVLSELWQDCGTGGAKGAVKTVKISGCSDTKNSCSMTRGTNVHCSMSFVPDRAVKELTARVKGNLNGLRIPFPLAKPDACAGCGLTCPLKANQKYTYTIQIPIEEYYPKVRVEVKLALIDQQPEEVACFMFLAQIV